MPGRIWTFRWFLPRHQFDSYEFCTFRRCMCAFGVCQMRENNFRHFISAYKARKQAMCQCIAGSAWHHVVKDTHSRIHVMECTSYMFGFGDFRQLTNVYEKTTEIRIISDSERIRLKNLNSNEQFMYLRESKTGNQSQKYVRYSEIGRCCFFP